MLMILSSPLQEDGRYLEGEEAKGEEVAKQENQYPK